MITHVASREEQGTVLGLVQSLTSVGQIIGPPLAGFLIQRELLSTWGILAAVITALGLALSLRQVAAPQQTIDQSAARS